MYGGVATILGFTFYGAVGARFVKVEQRLHPDHVIASAEEVPPTTWDQNKTVE